MAHVECRGKRSEGLEVLQGRQALRSLKVKV